jgi:hypothetical protein
VLTRRAGTIWLILPIIVFLTLAHRPRLLARSAHLTQRRAAVAKIKEPTPEERGRALAQKLKDDAAPLVPKDHPHLDGVK